MLRTESQARVEFQQFNDLDHANILHEAVMEAFRWQEGK